MTRHRWLVFGLALAGCTPFPGEPVPASLEVAARAPAAFAGDTVLISSAAFRGQSDRAIRLAPTDSAHLFIVVRRVDDTTVAFDVPPLLTGAYRFRVTVRDDAASAGEFTLRVGGQHGPTKYPGLRTNHHNALPLADGRVLVLGYPSQVSRYYVIDLATGLSTALAADGASVGSMFAPGPSVFRDRAVLDFAVFSSTDAAAYLTTTAEPARIHTLDWDVPGFDKFSAAELSDSTWLLLVDSELRHNGVRIFTLPGPAHHSELRLSATARRVVLLHRSPYQDVIGAWPVVDLDGAIAWTTSRYRYVAGAAFTPAGDTLFVAGRLASDSSWVVDLWEPGAGQLLGSMSFGDLRLKDVLVDPVRPRIYVAGATSRLHFPLYADPRPILTVLDRSTLNVLARIPGMTDFYAGCDGTLVHGRATGLVHLLSSCTRWIMVHTFDVP